ncbi:hypothetical protein AAKU55_000455 [Oxalobacteraceae bacterium GrIS 1.11]
MSTKSFNGAQLRRALLCLAICHFPLALVAAPLAPIPAAAPNWGSYLTPFGADSLWNSRPIEPTFTTFVIPKESNFPSVSGGAYSTGMFLSNQSDTPMVVYGASATGIWDPDTEMHRPSITIPHWPATTLPATGSDGHADIVDPSTGIIHSFWQLKQVNGKWSAAQYAWMPLAGRGFADPAHYFQGARAVGIPASAGLIRKHEADDGNPVFHHALAMSLSKKGLAALPAYGYPATSADSVPSTGSPNLGGIQEGALMMLPASYDTSKITNPQLRKVADTLKLYGAYVVDRNTDTPFVIYVENGAKFSLYGDPYKWDNAVAAELDRIRSKLGQLASAKSWVDGNGAPTTRLKPNMNALSMRAPWAPTSTGTAAGAFDTWSQAVQFPATAKQITQSKHVGANANNVIWGNPAVGSSQRFAVTATGGATLRLTVTVGSSVFFDSGPLGNGMSKLLLWPNGAIVDLVAASGVGAASSVKGELTTVTP